MSNKGKAPLKCTIAIFQVGVQGPLDATELSQALVISSEAKLHLMQLATSTFTKAEPT